MVDDKADEVMAEYLLKGGKMLAKSCNVCGYPLFEYKGETQCVICPLIASEGNQPPSEPPESVQVPPGSGGESVPSPAPVTSRTVREPQTHNPVSAELEATLIHLCERIRSEPRAGECLTLMKAVERGAEALLTLDQR
jgi:UPF0148 protein